MSAAGDWFAGALRSADDLADVYEPAEPRNWRKDIGRFDEVARRLIEATPIVMVATHDADGRCDVSPRGGQPGFVTILDDQHLALADATGNRRIDTLRNVVATGRAGLLFVIPGRDWTLRVNGAACVSTDPELLARIEPVGKPPKSAIVVRIEELYAHCPKAFVRSKLWDPASWPAADALPTPADVTLAHQRDPELTLAQVEQQQRESLLHRLA
jgi:PPOX class probable FMN-dependent enzyme